MSISKNISFGLLRTNPLLTTNIKIVTTGDLVYLESIDADPLLSDVRYKKYNVTGGSYQTDIHNFYNRENALVPKSIAYKVKDTNISINFKRSYDEQYDFTYCYGAEYKKSNLYKESISLFAPLWINPINIPDYFVIFKLVGSNSIDERGLTQNQIENEILNPDNFFKNYIKDAKIVKVFNLTKKTEIGKYIRNFVESTEFPLNPIFASIKKDDLSYCEGISYDRGGFCKKVIKLYQNFTLPDKTIIEKDNFITSSFSENGVIVSNILNLEFLFDDFDTKEFEFNRYYGFYMSENQLSELEFSLDATKSYFNKNKYDSNSITVNNLVENREGVVLGFKKEDKDLDILLESKPKFPYIKNSQDLFYSIKQSGETLVDSVDESLENFNFLRLKEEKILLSDFILSDKPVKYIESYEPKNSSSASFLFDVLDKPQVGDQIRILHTDTEDEKTKYFTIVGDNIATGTNIGLTFSTMGSLENIASAIAKAINYTKVINDTQKHYFTAINIKNKVIMYTIGKNSSVNKIKYSIFSTKSTFPFSIPNINGKFEQVDDYIDFEGINNVLSGWLFSHNLTGGSNGTKNRAYTNIDNLAEIFNEENKGFKKISKFKEDSIEIVDYAPYLDEPVLNRRGDIIDYKNIDKYIVFYTNKGEFEIKFNQIAFYESSKLICGLLKIYPVRDFDFDFYNTDYLRAIDSDSTRLKNYYLDKFLADDNPKNKEIIESIKFSNGKKSLLGNFNDITNSYDLSPKNEYDRLGENDISTFATVSKIIPSINKWVFESGCIDIRENPYRLNASGSFDYLNFSPAFRDFGINELNYTHEWYYLQEYPPYFSKTDKLNSFSYFDKKIETAELEDLVEDGFSKYFTRSEIEDLDVPEKLKYSKFYLNSETLFPETLFRGVKVLLKERLEFSELNGDISLKNFNSNPLFKDYKFSAVLTYGEPGIEVIKNDKFKNIALLIKSKFDDPFFEHEGKSFIDRLALYSLKDSHILDEEDLTLRDTAVNSFVFSVAPGPRFSIIPGAPFRKSYPHIISLTDNIRNDIILDKSGKYGDLIITDDSGETFEGELKYIRFYGVDIINDKTIGCNDIKYSSKINPTEGELLVLQRTKRVFVDFTNPDNYIVGLDKFPIEFSFNGNFSTQKLIRLKKFFTKNKLKYINGGFNKLEAEIKELSFANIAQKINSGNSSVLYKSIKSDGSIVYNDFCLELLKPIDELTLFYKVVKEDNKTIFDSNTFFNTVSLQLKNRNRIIASPISRHRGYHKPKFLDVINILGDESFNTEIYTDKNTGIIKNLFYNKINRFGNIPTRVKLGIKRLQYGEISIDKKDFSIFKSTFDSNYYNEYTGLINNVGLIGLVNPTETKSFFGSKLLSVPERIVVSKFDDILEQNINLNQIMFKTYESSDLSTVLNINIDFKKLLVKKLLELGIEEGFKNLNINRDVNNNLSIFIEKYITNNILEKYIIKDIIVWENIYDTGYNLKEIENQLSEQDKIDKGFKQIKNYLLEFKTNSNVTIKYTIPQYKKYSISFTFIIEKIK